MTTRVPAETQKSLAFYTLIVIVTTLFINLLSAYIRHIDAGLDCQPWPQCYAQVGEQVQAEDSGKIAQQALAPIDGVKKTHRAVASFLVFAVLFLIHQSRKPNALKGANPTLPYLLLAVIILLAIIGPASYLKTLPIIALLNLAGGVTLLAIAWWLYLQLAHQSLRTHDAPVWINRLWMVALAITIVQILLGAWVSANFAADACRELLACNAAGEYLKTGSSGFGYLRELNLDETGRIIFDSSSVSIHLTHRLFSLLTGSILIASAVALYKYHKRLALIVIALLSIQAFAGLISILLSVPLMVVMIHNLNATLLLIAVMTVNFKLGPAQ